jgi:hypothetical protein
MIYKEERSAFVQVVRRSAGPAVSDSYSMFEEGK